MRKDFFKTKWHGVLALLMLATCLGGYTSCSKYDLDEIDPEGWGASIYNYLEEDGNYQNTINLINDLGYRNVLEKTRTSTLFVADDQAYDRFYQNNEWGVRKYEDLSTAQKKMLLLGNLMNNPYQVHDLASIEGPQEGVCLRRTGLMGVFDTISVVKTMDLPNMKPGDEIHNATWQKFKDRESIVLMRDNSVRPLVYFIEAQMKNNKITNDDYNFLFNYTTSREDGDASVNGVIMEKQNIKCSNGFIHKLADVIVPLDNMAEVVAKKPQVSQFNKLLERFCAPFYVGKELTDQYNYLYDTKVDSVFQKRFMSLRSHGSKLLVDDDKKVYQEAQVLNWDPEWNTFYVEPGIPSPEVALERDMAVMLAPSNEALDFYWNKGEGQVLRDQYGSWDNVPNSVVVEFLNNNLLSSTSFTQSVPSKFANILNDANDPMGLKKEAIDSVWLACNGAVYCTNQVYAPTSFVSVLYPAIINEALSVVKWAVENNNYKVYLNSLNSRYSFFIPANGSFLSYIDPSSYGKPTAQLYRFHYDPKATNPVWASIFEWDEENQCVGDSIDEVRNNNDLMKAKLKEVLDNHIVIGDVEDGNHFYRTKGGQEIYVENAKLGENGMTVQGSYQINDAAKKVKVKYVYDQTEHGNGKAYILEDEPIMTTRHSVLDMIRMHPEMDEFRKLLEGSGMVESIHKVGKDNRACVSENLGVFNTYHYTIYVPTNSAVKAAKLPSWDDVDKANEMGDKDKAVSDSLAIENFLRYHIQDYALFIGAKPASEDGYETALINPRTEKFERVYATLKEDDLSIKTSQADKNPAHVVKTPGLYNIMAREYILNSDDGKTANGLYTSSTAVIHLIDKALVK